MVILSDARRGNMRKFYRIFYKSNFYFTRIRVYVKLKYHFFNFYVQCVKRTNSFFYGSASAENEARLESTSIFPNPVSTDRKLNIAFFDHNENSKKLILMDQNGVILKKISDNISSGKHNYSILLDDIVLSTEVKSLYYRLENKQHNEVKRVVLAE